MKLVKAVANDHCEQRKRTSKDETSVSATKRNNGADWLHERCIIREELIMGFTDGGGGWMQISGSCMITVVTVERC